MRLPYGNALPVNSTIIYYFLFSSIIVSHSPARVPLTNDRQAGVDAVIKKKEGDCLEKYLAGTMLILMLTAGGTLVSQPEEISKRPPPPKENMKPPQEAYTACKGKTEGTVVEFITPRGETIKGLCRVMDGAMVAVPERKGLPPGGSNKPGAAKSITETK